MMQFRTLTHIALLLTLLSACTKGENLRTVRDYQVKWKKTKSPDYSYVFYVDCKCPRKDYSPARIVVRDDEIHRIEDIFTGLPMRVNGESTLVQDVHSDDFYTIDGLFDLLMNSRRVSERQVEFHESFGHPTHIYIDYKARVKDDELTFEIRGLVFD